MEQSLEPGDRAYVSANKYPTCHFFEIGTEVTILSEPSLGDVMVRGPDFSAWTNIRNLHALPHPEVEGC